MPVNRYGQLITFAVEIDEDQRYKRYIWIDLKVGDTVQKIASRRGHPEDARRVADLNDIRSITTVLRHKPKRRNDRTRLRVPGALRAADVVNVNAGDSPPRPVRGYQKLEIIDRPGRVGLTHFTGYDPIAMEVPIRFENFIAGEGVDIEDDCETLERMAGRGNFKGAGVGPAPVIRISTTSSSGNLVPLLPRNYQYSRQNPSAPLWRISNIDWADDVPEGVFRNRAGNRIRQKAIVTVEQYSHVAFEMRSATARSG